MKESKWQKALMDYLRSQGAVVFNVHGGLMQAGGWPDLQVYHPTWTGHLELKVNRNASSSIPRQGKRIRDLREVGTEAFFLLWVSPARYDVVLDVDPENSSKIGETMMSVNGPGKLLESLHGVLRSKSA